MRRIGWTAGVLLAAHSAHATERIERPVRQIAPEMEVGAGVTSREDLLTTIQLRAGFDLFELVTPSVRFFTAAPWSSLALSIWAVQADVRVHSRGAIQAVGGLSFGVASASLGAPLGSTAPFVGRPPAPWLTGDVGGRLRLGSLFLGLSVGMAFLQPRFLGSLTVGFAESLESSDSDDTL
jgi:hypothetical protein